jgi:hypothetical protein
MKTCKRVLFSVLLAPLPITLAGCIPGITWLPDSSGFVYTGGNDGERLMLFDLAKGTPQTLVADTKCHTTWPAVSPDGKHTAVARLVHEKNKRDTLQILIYDMKGKITQRSSKFSISEVTKEDNRPDVLPTEVFWGPKNKIIVSAWTQSLAVAIFDVKADRIVTVQGAHATPFDGKPFRPDGKGFLITKETNKIPALSLVDWEGHEHPIALNLPGQESKDLEDMLYWPVLCTSSWKGNQAIVFTSRARCEIDTDKLVGRYQSTAADHPNSDNSIRQHFDFPNGSNALQIVDWTKRVRQDSEEKFSRLEFVDLRQRRTTRLRESSAYAVLFASPDGKHVAVRWPKDDKEESIWVIDQDGKIAAKIKVPE